jgi:SAM-dependent methyltransferase
VLRRSHAAQRLASRIRPQQFAIEGPPHFIERKQRKLRRIAPLLKRWQPHTRTGYYYDFLDERTRNEFHITDTENVSAFDYDEFALPLIDEYRDGWILDCGAGARATYYENVVNFEISPYPTTDVRGVGERLPFRDNVFDVVFSLQVLEHVRDPFACAGEITRVLKPSGKLYCVVPFLQPYHGYPAHYFNMSAQGLASLFEDRVVIDRQEVSIAGRPIWTLSWILERWAEELDPEARAEFLDQRVGDLMGDRIRHLSRSWVARLPEAANFELASTTSLFAHKPEAPPRRRRVRR